MAPGVEEPLSAGVRRGELAMVEYIGVTVALFAFKLLTRRRQARQSEHTTNTS